MIVKGLRESQDQVSDPDQIKKPETIVDSCKEFVEMKGPKMSTEDEGDMESGGSSEEVKEAMLGKVLGRRGKVHYQVLKIKEEESHLGEDIREGLSAKDRIGAVIRGCDDYNHHYNRLGRRPAKDVVILSKPILPNSPLSGKTPVKALH